LIERNKIFDCIVIYNQQMLYSIFHRIYLYLILKNNVGIKEKVNEKDRKAPKIV